MIGAPETSARDGPVGLSSDAKHNWRAGFEKGGLISETGRLILETGGLVSETGGLILETGGLISGNRRASFENRRASFGNRRASFGNRRANFRNRRADFRNRKANLENGSETGGPIMFGITVCEAPSLGHVLVTTGECTWGYWGRGSPCMHNHVQNE